MDAHVVTKEEALAYLAYAKFDITDTDVADDCIKLVRIEVAAWLVRRKINFAAIENLTDDLEFIWAASFCLLLEMLSMRGQIQQSSGDVAMQKIGNMQTMFQRWQPMFFFAKGMALGFYDLLPHATYRMLAMQHIRSYISWKFMQDHSSEVAWGTVSANLDKESNAQFFGTQGEKLNGGE